ncbi:hypothetical protein C8R44DRAFT_929270 [Mycena epipterygia]|nr:hypothetical protein C8R44DRAFT_929270 [Mycena epipterygia]
MRSLHSGRQMKLKNLTLLNQVYWIMKSVYFYIFGRENVAQVPIRIVNTAGKGRTRKNILPSPPLGESRCACARRHEELDTSAGHTVSRCDGAIWGASRELNIEGRRFVDTHLIPAHDSFAKLDTCAYAYEAQLEINVGLAMNMMGDEVRTYPGSIRPAMPPGADELEGSESLNERRESGELKPAILKDATSHGERLKCKSEPGLSMASSLVLMHRKSRSGRNVAGLWDDREERSRDSGVWVECAASSLDTLDGEERRIKCGAETSSGALLVAKKAGSHYLDEWRKAAEWRDDDGGKQPGKISQVFLLSGA